MLLLDPPQAYYHDKTSSHCGVSEGHEKEMARGGGGDWNQNSWVLCRGTPYSTVSSE